VHADGTIWCSSSRLLIEFPLERYELYAHRLTLPQKTLTQLKLMKRLWYPFRGCTTTINGRGAWLALKEHFDGPSNQIRLKAEAYMSICRAEYKGAKNFSYELYRRIHTQAHSDLARFGEPVPEVKKVKDFLDGITDSTLQPVEYTITGLSHLMESFHEAANYIGNIIDLNKKNEF